MADLVQDLKIYNQLANEVDYGLACMVETLSATCDQTRYFELFHPDTNAWFNEVFERPGIPFNQREQIFLGIYEDWYKSNPYRIDRQICLLHGLEGLRFQIPEMCIDVADSFLRSCMTQGLGTTKVSRRLDSPKARRKHFKRYVGNDTRLSNFVGHIGLLLDRAIRTWRHNPTFLDSAIKGYNQLQERLDELNRDNVERIRAALPELTRGVKLVHSKIQARKRKALLKSFGMLSDLMGHDTMQMFVSGGAIQLEGKRFTYTVSLNYLYSFGHAGCIVTLLDKKSKDKISNLCVYFADTPPAEQLVSFALYIMHGQEDKILEIGNTYNIVDMQRLKASMPKNLMKTIHRMDPEINIFDTLPRRYPDYLYTLARSAFRDTCIEYIVQRNRIYGSNTIQAFRYYLEKTA